MGYTVYVDWIKKEIQMTESWTAEMDELIEREMFMEHCWEMGIPTSRKNWAKFKDHRRRVLAKWEKIAEERMENV